MSCSGLTHHNKLANSVISNRVTLLLQSVLRMLSIINDWHVVPINIWWARNQYSYNPQLIPYSLEGFHDNLHGHKLRPKHRHLYRGLILGEPLNRRSFQEDKKSWARPPCLLLSRVVAIDILTQVNWLSPFLRGFRWDSLLLIPIKILPLTLLTIIRFN